VSLKRTSRYSMCSSSGWFIQTDDEHWLIIL
jgi:hypothetical protein